jgi:hypothetical protein
MMTDSGPASDNTRNTARFFDAGMRCFVDEAGSNIMSTNMGKSIGKASRTGSARKNGPAPAEWDRAYGKKLTQCYKEKLLSASAAVAATAIAAGTAVTAAARVASRRTRRALPWRALGRSAGRTLAHHWRRNPYILAAAAGRVIVHPAAARPGVLVIPRCAEPLPATVTATGAARRRGRIARLALSRPVITHRLIAGRAAWIARRAIARRDALRVSALSRWTAEAPPTAGTLILRCGLHAAIPVLRLRCLSGRRRARVARCHRGRPAAGTVEGLPRD